jgi:hypothetical protein
MKYIVCLHFADEEAKVESFAQGHTILLSGRLGVYIQAIWLQNHVILPLSSSR